VSALNWTYWALNTEDSYALLGSNYMGLANPNKSSRSCARTNKGRWRFLPGRARASAGARERFRIHGDARALPESGVHFVNEEVVAAARGIAVGLGVDPSSVNFGVLDSDGTVQPRGPGHLGTRGHEFLHRPASGERLEGPGLPKAELAGASRYYLWTTRIPSGAVRARPSATKRRRRSSGLHGRTSFEQFALASCIANNNPSTATPGFSGERWKRWLGNGMAPTTRETGKQKRNLPALTGS